MIQGGDFVNVRDTFFSSNLFFIIMREGPKVELTAWPKE